MSTATPTRIGTPRHYLMCRPTYFNVEYTINPWMDPDVPTDTGKAVAEWESLRAVYRELGHRVDLIDPVPGLPDMVYAANGATVLGDRVLVANFRHEQRSGESTAYKEWFQQQPDGYQVTAASYTNEGEGDYLVAGRRILAGTGFRTEPAAHAEAQDVFGTPVVTLTLIDPRYYHLDTALAVLDDETVMYNPAAFSPGSLTVLKTLYPDAILATDEEAGVFGLNAVSDGHHVVLSAAAPSLAAKLSARGFTPIAVALPELLKGGGSIKCCTLELRHAPSR